MQRTDPGYEEVVFRALAARMELVTWRRLDANNAETGPVLQFATKSREVKLFADSGKQPACYQAEFSDMSNQVTNLAYKEVWEANWIVYQDVSKNPGIIATSENNLILDGIRRALRPMPNDVGFHDERCTLGNLVHHCFIQGRIFKDPGDIDQQGMLVVPIKLLIP